MRRTTGGVVRRAVAGGASAALAVAGLALAAAPAHAAPVTVTGTLTDAAGNVLDGYVAALVQQPDGTFTYGPTQYVVDGVISLPVEPGVYKFEFGDQEDNFVSEFYNDKATEATAEAVPVSGPVTLAPVVLASRPAYVGQVLSPSGRPVEDAWVEVLDPTTGNSIASGRTRPDGAFRVAAPAGQYKIRISGSGFSPEYYNNKATLAAADLVGLGGADVGLGTITLQEGTTVTGKAANPAGTGIERIAVTLSPTGSGSSFTDYTDAAGMLRLEGVAPGTYKVRFSDPIGEYLTEYWNDKPDFATGDVLTVGLDPVNDVNAVLSPDPSNVAPDPATVDLSGVITDSAGKPVAGATVEIWDTPADGDRREVIDSTYTNRGGSYHFTRLDKAYLSEDTFKVRAEDNFSVEEGSYNRLPRWWGGAQTYAGARTVGVPTSAVNVALPLTGGVSGTITSEAGLPVGSVQVTLFDADGNGSSAYGYAGVEENGTFSTTSLVPGTYKVLFNGSSPWSSGIFDHAPEWYDDTTFEKAKVITVRSGQTVTGIDAALSQQFKALRKPEIRGNQYLGGKLRAWSGVWALKSNTTYLYEWLIGDTVVGTGRTYEVTKAAKNKRITLRVLAENGNLTGTALVSTQVIKKKPKVSITIKGSKATVLVKAKKVKPRKFKGTVVVKKIVRTDDYGAPVYKTVGKAKLRNGSAALTLKKLARGKNKLVFFVTLKGGKYGDAEVAKTVRVKG